MTASVIHPRPPRPPIDWRSVRVIAALTIASGALMWAGVTLIAVGEVRLGWWAIGAGLLTFVAAGQETW